MPASSQRERCDNPRRSAARHAAARPAQRAIALVLLEVRASPRSAADRSAPRRQRLWSGHAWPCQQAAGARTDADLGATAGHDYREVAASDLQALCASDWRTTTGYRSRSRVSSRSRTISSICSKAKPVVRSRRGTAGPVVPIRNSRQGERQTTFSFSRAGEARQFPAWDIDGHIVWGLTFRVLERGFSAGLSGVCRARVSDVGQLAAAAMGAQRVISPDAALAAAGSVFRDAVEALDSLGQCAQCGAAFGEAYRCRCVKRFGRRRAEPSALLHAANACGGPRIPPTSSPLSESEVGLLRSARSEQLRAAAFRAGSGFALASGALSLFQYLRLVPARHVARAVRQERSAGGKPGAIRALVFCAPPKPRARSKVGLRAAAGLALGRLTRSGRAGRGGRCGQRGNVGKGAACRRSAR